MYLNIYYYMITSNALLLSNCCLFSLFLYRIITAPQNNAIGNELCPL